MTFWCTIISPSIVRFKALRPYTVHRLIRGGDHVLSAASLFVPLRRVKSHRGAERPSLAPGASWPACPHSSVVAR